MDKILKSTLTLLLAIACSNANAFSLKDIVTSENVEAVVSTITGGTSVTTSSIAGTWTYKNSAVKLESDNTLTELAGTAATSQIESKLDSALAKVGITSGLMTFTFGSDSSFSCTTKSKTLSGTYTINSDSQITLNFSAVGTVNIGKVTAYTELTSTTLTLLFDADKLLSIVSAVTSITDNSTLSTIDSLLSNYNGVQIGFDFSK
ncbi:MAG: DUF4923 family protein [Rikenellaceae bacterium]